jgi:IS30 family transposase
LGAKIQSLPQAVRQSLTWDQGPEMRDWKQVKVAADIDIFFCDPRAPWQRATNENTVSLVVARLGWSGRLVPAA